MNESHLQDKRVTDLPGRAQVVESIQALLTACEKKELTRFSVFLLNLNRFRSINETLSYATGDRVIREVGKRLVQMRSDVDTVGHLGGDEFVLVMSRVEDPYVATQIADAIAKKIAASIRFRNREVFVNASVGIVLGSGEYARPEDVIRDAAIALDHARTEKDTSAMFKPSMRKRAVKRQQIETDLRYAIVCNELEVYYQPIVRLHDAALCGAEALVRWNHPTNGLMSPAEFIPVAESSGLIKPMTIGIMKDSCSQLVEWNSVRVDTTPLMLSVNLSVTHFNDRSLVHQIRDVITETGIVPAHLKLEITEGAVMDDAEQAIDTLKRIKELGVSISIDDFGTGYSSLSYLHKFPIDYLKIDRSFVAAMEDADENLQIVKTILTLASALKFSVIAEGIETKAQWDLLNELGCQFGQGFLFAKPMPAKDLTHFIDGRQTFASMGTPVPEADQLDTLIDASDNSYLLN